MSTTSRSDTDDSLFDIEELLHIEARCKELRREKDLLKETQSQSFDLIKRLELHVRRLNEARQEDKRQIQELERELSNCHQEIDYLQDQLNARSADVDCLEERVCSLELKLADADLLEEQIVSLREELKKSNSECEFLMQELENNATELQKSSLLIEKLEESISSTGLEYQCEIESTKLEMMALEQRCFEAKKSEEESCREKAILSKSLHELELRFGYAQKTIRTLENENTKVKDMLDGSEREVELFCQRLEEHFKGRIGRNEAVQTNVESNTSDQEYDLVASIEVGPCGKLLGPLLSKVLMIRTKEEKLSRELDEYELVKQLKEQLKEEKSRAKEEAEDLAQEMAELRYQMTELLEEERKRRACIEQASLQRISDLERQLRMERGKSVAPIRGICEA